jgi:hypothetical protein
MTTPVDFVLESPETNTLLLVEAKATNSPSPEWAGRFVRNLLSQRRLPPNLYFLLVLRNYLYLWKHLPIEGSDLPDVAARTEDVLRPYLESISTPLRQMNGASFELLVRSWLLDLAEGNAPALVEEWARGAGLNQFTNSVIREDQPN